MSKLQHFLEKLTDEELVNFHHYRYREFLKASKYRIDSEIEKRDLKPKLSGYSDFPSDYGRPKNDEEICPRCLSSKFYTSNEIETITYSYASVDFEVDHRICLVCLYSASKDRDSHKHVSAFGFLRRLMNRKR